MESQLLIQLCQSLREIDIEPKTISIRLFHKCTKEEVNKLIHFCQWIKTLEEFEKKFYSMILKGTMMMVNEREMADLLNEFHSTQLNFIDENEKNCEARKVR